MATDGWILKFIKTNHRCWFVRGCSILIASLLCMSCGKKIEDRNSGKVQANKTNIKPKESQLNFMLRSNGEYISASHYIQDRFFFKIPSFIDSSEIIEKLSIYFHVIGKGYEYVCDYENENAKLVFQECIDDEGYTIKHLVPGEEIHLPSGEELFIESRSSSHDQVEVVLDIINK